MLEHGGNLGAAASEYGIPLQQWLDLSTGINPHGYPVPAIPAELWQRLPLQEDGLTAAAKAYYGAEHLLPTAGSQAIIQSLPLLRPACRVTLCGTTYNEHAHSWGRQGHQVAYFDRIPDSAMLQYTDVLVICNPNNPTGQCIATDTLLDWHAQLSARGGWLVIDEAFMDSTPENSLAGHAHLPGLFVLRSLGKFFGLAGTRVGFLLAQESRLRQLEELLGPWTVSGPSRHIAKTALLDKEWQEINRTRLEAGSERMLTLLKQYGLSPQGRTALFVWVPTDDAIAWHIHLARHGIWTRLYRDWSALRFGLPDEAGWVKLEHALASFIR